MKSEEPVWDEFKFTEYGKWMDGWESRRRRTEGHDWCVIKLNIPGEIHSIEVDTCHFTGNYSPKVSIQGCYIEEDSVCSVSSLILRQLRNLGVYIIRMKSISCYHCVKLIWILVLTVVWVCVQRTKRTN